ncbi:hypothetical protein [uncultured Devosia sp.]|uniref:hypothetical protein n=1 Tax=uncultured Devosia sp. TaxID=211434 RepID=UPI0035CA7644
MSLAFALLGCTASQATRPYVGKTATDLMIDWGRPVNQFDAPDGRRISQYYWGGGTIVLPATGSATSTVIGNSVFTNATMSPGAVVENEGCLVSFIQEKRGSEWFVIEARYPDRAFC